MTRILLLLSLLFALPAFGADRVIINPDSNGDLKIKVNVGGTPTDAITVTGSTAKVETKGTTTNDSACAGCVGEFVSANASSFAPADGAYENVASISLTAGDWDVEGTVVLASGTMTGLTAFSTCISTVSATCTVLNAGGVHQDTTAASGIGSRFWPTGLRRITLTATTTVYLLGFVDFTTVGTASYATSSNIRARRVR